MRCRASKRQAKPGRSGNRYGKRYSQQAADHRVGLIDQETDTLGDGMVGRRSGGDVALSFDEGVGELTQHESTTCPASEQKKMDK